MTDEQNPLEAALHAAFTALKDAHQEAERSVSRAARHSKPWDDAKLMRSALERAIAEVEHAMTIHDPFLGLDDTPERFYRPLKKQR